MSTPCLNTLGQDWELFITLRREPQPGRQKCVVVGIPFSCSLWAYGFFFGIMLIRTHCVVGQLLLIVWWRPLIGTLGKLKGFRYTISIVFSSKDLQSAKLVLGISFHSQEIESLLLSRFHSCILIFCWSNSCAHTYGHTFLERAITHETYRFAALTKVTCLLSHTAGYQVQIRGPSLLASTLDPRTVASGVNFKSEYHYLYTCPLHASINQTAANNWDLVELRCTVVTTAFHLPQRTHRQLNQGVTTTRKNSFPRRSRRSFSLLHPRYDK
jgi:hypothetical protein